MFINNFKGVVKLKRNEFKYILNLELYSDIKRGFFKKLILKYLNPSTNAVYLIRRFQFFNESKYFKLISFCYQFSLAKKYGIFISKTTEIQCGLHLPHPNGIVLGSAVKIGKNCTIYQQVTVGSKRVGDSKKNLQPIIKENVYLFSGSKVIGDIVLECNTHVAANAVLTTSTEAFGTYAGIPAKLVSINDYTVSRNEKQ